MPPQNTPQPTAGIPQQAPVTPHGGSSLGKIVILLLAVLLVAGGAYWYTTPGGSKTESGMRVYENTEYGYQLEHPASLSAQAATTRSISYGGSPEAMIVPLPADSVEIPGYLIISPIPYSELSSDKGIFDYYNCCSGANYSYDEAKKEWKSEEIFYDADAPTATSFRPQSLMENGSCKIAQTQGQNTYYVIPSGDEGIPTDYHYYLLTNKGYALRFLSAYDLQADYSTYPDELKPDPNVLKTIADILTSVTLPENVTAVEATCADAPSTDAS